jgi:uncharacterized caspase-like protein
LRDYEEAIRLDPGYTAALTNRALWHEAKGDRDRARADFNAALALPPKYSNGKWAHDKARERLAALGSDIPAISAALNPGPTLQQANLVTPIASGRRVALVIGNGAYRTMPALRNPANDAGDVARQLRAMNFEVTDGIDLARNDFEEALIRFARESRDAEVALVYYAGHGLQHNGINYLIPVDARIDSEADLRRLVQVQSVMEDLKTARGVRILILDACRDNDAVQRVAGLEPTRAAAFDRGLSRMDKDNARGAFVVYAAQPNAVAKDGDGRNSPFTSALLRHLPTAGIELRTLMTRVRADVVRDSSGTQWPEVSDSLIGEVVFKAGR